MCGISGQFRISGGAVDRGILERMSHAIVHRGPDDEGFLVEPGIGLAHRRFGYHPHHPGERDYPKSNGKPGQDLHDLRTSPSQLPAHRWYGCRHQQTNQAHEFAATVKRKTLLVSRCQVGGPGQIGDLHQRPAQVQKQRPAKQPAATTVG